MEKQFQSQADKLRELKSRMQNFPSQRQRQAPVQASTSQENMTQTSQVQEQPTLNQEQIQTIQRELEQIAKLQDNGIYRLEILKNLLESRDILIDFGTMLFDRLDAINSNLSKLATSIENFSIADEQKLSANETDELDED